MTRTLSDALRLLQAGDDLGADLICREVLAAQPDNADALHLRGIVALRAGDAAVAVDLIRNAVAINGANATYYVNLAHALTQAGRGGEAIAAARQAVALNPQAPDAHNNLGVALEAEHFRHEAAEAYARAVQLDPAYAVAHTNLGSVLHDLGRLDEAAKAYRDSLTAAPGDAAARTNLGTVLQAQGDIDAAGRAYREAIAAEPSFAPAHFNLGNVLQQTKHFDDAAAAYRQAIALDPAYVAAYINLARIFFRRGLTGEAIALLETAVAIAPTSVQAHSNLLYAHCFDGRLSPIEMRLAAERFARAACPPAEPLPRRLDPTRPLKIGIVSAEIGSHAISRFLGSFLRHYNRERFPVTLYETQVQTGPMRDELLALAGAKRDISRLDDDTAHRQIAADGIDILIDTAGHIGDSRPALFARRCAPVQAHYIGYHGTTGIPAMDYFIGDGEITPPEFQPAFTETLIRLPQLWIAFDPPRDAPEPRAKTTDGPITFGCFNILAKAGPATLDLWGQVLARVPGSLLVLKYQDNADPVIQARTLKGLARHDIAPDRVRFLDWVPDWRAHMALYNTIDIALDTMPLNSGTTGFDALYMATPLVAMRGHWMGGRMSSAMLKALGHLEWIAETPEHYVDIAARLASDPAALRAHKRTLRREMLASQLCDGAGLARALEDAFVTMATRTKD